VKVSEFNKISAYFLLTTIAVSQNKFLIIENVVRKV